MNTIKEAIKDIKNGKMVIVVDDENRENEGDLIMAADVANYESINFMATHARGLICVPLSEDRINELNLSNMVDKNTDQFCTAFTVSVDSRKDTTTGISIADRLATVKTLVNKNTKPEDLRTPGHLFPLIAKSGGVIERNGHTEAATDLARLAGFSPAGVICEILNDNGTMARLPELKKYSKKHNLKIISIKDLIHYIKANEVLVEKSVEATLPTKWGDFRIMGFDNKLDDKEHIVLVKGNPEGKKNILVRFHSECFTGDVLGSLRCDCMSQLHQAMEQVEKEGEGVIIYLKQEGRGIGLFNKIKAYNLQDKGFDTLDANLELGFDPDLRDYALAAQFLKYLDIDSVRLLTNNPEKISGLEDYGIKVSERISIETCVHDNNRAYLKTKKKRFGHFLDNIT